MALQVISPVVSVLSIVIISAVNVSKVMKELS
jgi:hypothetical protein